MNWISFLDGYNVFQVAFGVLLILCLVFLFLNIRFFILGQRMQRLLRGTNSKDLEALLYDTIMACRETEEQLAKLQQLCEELQKSATKSLQNVGFLRFNAFPDMGSDLSFTLALLNNNKDGIVLCCLVGRDDCRLYAKPVVAGRSTYPLSEEEQVVIRQACAQVSSNIRS
jgi:hypothetical protein